ncbi:MAG: sugar transferase [Zoogloeaceae bacterium]|jgi:lipopolysaccharide/colanic/teichoic acid biosynthesis glycosyltransferase|nr:sugar transferase [Zoogloeaceae bacterium]
MTRFLDVLLSLLGLSLGAPLLLALFALGLLDTGSPLFFQTRVGRNQRLFTLVKFRTMRPDAAHVATHLADASAITRWGAFLRRVKFDELPQLWNVLKGEMSLAGPRPCLPTQTELIAERARRGVFSARPGVTGLAQVQGIDMSDPARLAEVDAQMLQELSVGTYFRYIFLTALGRGTGDRVRRKKPD